jgi:tetraacyldisaccharide 4'-kinase
MKSAKDLLAPCSWLFSAGVRIRHFLYDRKIFTQKVAPLPVISIGNVVAGGAGKTQATLLLAELLSKELRVAVLSRGYKSQAENAQEPLLVKVDQHTPRMCGDEPWLLASRLQTALIYVNKNRYKSALQAKKMGAQVIVLDDGMQHRKLHRDLEIVVIDGKLPFGNFLPQGHLREDLQRLKKANLILFVGEPDVSILQEVALFTNAPQAFAKITPVGIFHLDGSEASPLKDKSVAIFCGIGNPVRFVQNVEELGAHVVATHFSSDHQRMSEKELKRFALLARSRGASVLVCTEKDKVKLSQSNLPLPILWVRATLEIIRNQEEWAKTVRDIKFLVSQQL